jgi:hypothetical protein
MKIVVLLLLLSFALAFETEASDSLAVEIVKDFTDDNDTVTFNLYDLYDDEMATYIKVTLGVDQVEKTLLVDISTYMTIIFEPDTFETDRTIFYRDPTPLNAKFITENLVVSGFLGPSDQREPELKDFSVSYSIAHVVYEPDSDIKHDGILGIASITNSGASTLSFFQKMVQKGIFKTESFMFSDVALNTTVEQYQSKITFGFSGLPGSDDYLMTDNPIPSFSSTDFNSRKSYQTLLLDIGLKEVDILNYFDIADFDDSNSMNSNSTVNRLKSQYNKVIIDSAVKYVQLPETIMSYFDRTFFSDNCINGGGEGISSCGCVGSDYGGLPSINFRFRDYLRYTLSPEDYMSPPLINTTTREPYCRLGVFSHWAEDYPNICGLGKIFINKFKLVVVVNRAANTYSIGYVRGYSYKSWRLILPTILYYFFVITILSSLAIWLSIKKYKRLEEEKKKSKPLLQDKDKMEGLKKVSKTLRKMDFSMNMSAYNKVFERQRAQTVHQENE